MSEQIVAEEYFIRDKSMQILLNDDIIFKINYWGTVDNIFQCIMYTPDKKGYHKRYFYIKSNNFTKIKEKPVMSKYKTIIDKMIILLSDNLKI